MPVMAPAESPSQRVLAGIVAFGERTIHPAWIGRVSLGASCHCHGEQKASSHLDAMFKRLILTIGSSCKLSRMMERYQLHISRAVPYTGIEEANTHHSSTTEARSYSITAIARAALGIPPTESF